MAGNKFKPLSVIRFDLSGLPTEFVSESTWTAAITGALLKKVGSYAVPNPGSLRTPSSGLYYLVNFRD